MIIMEKFVIFTLFILESAMLAAQDKIITKEGETIIGYGTEVGATSIFYREKADESAPTLKVAKNLVLMVKYQNGEKQMMEGDAKMAAIPSAQSSPKTESEDMSISAEENAAMMARYMPEVTYTGKAKGKNARVALCQLAFTKGSVIADKNIEIIYTPGDAYRGNWSDLFASTERAPRSLIKSFIPIGHAAYKLSIRNRTNKTIFVVWQIHSLCVEQMLLPIMCQPPQPALRLLQQVQA